MWGLIDHAWGWLKERWEKRPPHLHIILPIVPSCSLIKCSSLKHKVKTKWLQIYRILCSHGCPVHATAARVFFFFLFVHWDGFPSTAILEVFLKGREVCSFPNKYTKTETRVNDHQFNLAYVSPTRAQVFLESTALFHCLLETNDIQDSYGNLMRWPHHNILKSTFFECFDVHIWFCHFLLDLLSSLVGIMCITQSSVCDTVSTTNWWWTATKILSKTKNEQMKSAWAATGRNRKLGECSSVPESL